MASVLVAALLAGCARPAMRTPVDRMAAGQYGQVRTALYREMTHDRNDKDYLLDRARVGVVTLADGYAESARTVLMPMYDRLREQGVNRDKDAATLLLNEDVRTWKGEPYEQALAMLYVGMAAAQRGEWDNARAAAANARTLLQDLSGEALAEEQAIVERSRRYEQAIAAGLTPAEAKRRVEAAEAPGHTQEAMFTLACVLGAAASQQLGRDEEAADYFRRAGELNGELRPVLEPLWKGRCNALLIVSFGQAPHKELGGGDDSVVTWRARTASDPRPLRVRLDDAEAQRFAVAEDVNRLATRYNWNRFAKLRQGKRVAGDLLLVGGAAATVIGADQGSGEAIGAGLGAVLFGVVMKAGAHGDPRYNDLLPQRYYVVPLRIDSPDQRITLRLGAAAVVLSGLRTDPGDSVGDPGDPGLRGGLVFRYVRLPEKPGRWATSGERFAFEPPIGAATTIEETGGYAGLHVLEGGDSAVAPDGATVGEARLFGVSRRKIKETGS